MKERVIWNLTDVFVGHDGRISFDETISHSRRGTPICVGVCRRAGIGTKIERSVDFGSRDSAVVERPGALAVTAAVRAEALPDLATVGEFVPGFEATQWYGVVGPKGTPAGIVDTLNKQINAGLTDSRLKARFAELGGMVLTGSPADFAKLIADETEKWAKVIRAANIKPV
jgi:hypothetical protein